MEYMQIGLAHVHNARSVLWWTGDGTCQNDEFKIESGWLCRLEN